MTRDNKSAVSILPRALPTREKHKDEMNFSEFAMVCLADNVPESVKSLEFNDHIIDESTGQLVSRKLTVTSASAYGLPRGLDSEIILALIHITNRQSFESPTVHFSIYEIVDILGLNRSAKTYKRIEEGLNRLVGTTLYWDNGWWSAEDESLINAKFHILQGMEIVTKELRAKRKSKNVDDKNAGRSRFTWDSTIFKSFKAGNLKELDWEIYQSLKSLKTKKMYRFLDKRMYNRRFVEFDLHTFATAYVGLSNTIPTAELKRLIAPAIEELENAGFIAKKEKSERFLKHFDGSWRIKFERGKSEALHLMSTEQQKLYEELKSRGVLPNKASKLVRQYALETIIEKIALRDWYLSKNDKRCSSNPAGFLVSAIQNPSQYPLPEHFLQSREQAKSALKLILREERKEVKEDLPTSPSATEVRFQNWWKGLSDAQQQEFEQKAVIQSQPFDKRIYVNGKEKGGQGASFKTIRNKILIELFEATYNQVEEL